METQASTKPAAVPPAMSPASLSAPKRGTPRKGVNASIPPGTSLERPVTIVQTTVADILKVAEHAATIADADQTAKGVREKESAFIWNAYLKLGDELGSLAFSAHWEYAKGLIIKPESAAFYGSVASTKKPGKFTVSKYLSETVSRVKSALFLAEKSGGKFKLRDASGKMLGQSALAAEIKKANEKAAERERAKKDPNYKVRSEISALLAGTALIVRKGSHDLPTLEKVRNFLQDLNKLLGVKEPETQKKAA